MICALTLPSRDLPLTLLVMAIISTLIQSDVVICHTGANYDTGIFYMLTKNSHLMFLRTKQTYDRYPPIDYEDFTQITRAYDKGLQLVQTVAEHLPFGRSLWVDLEVGHRGDVVLHCKEGPLYGDVCMPWGDVIDEKEIAITKCLFMEEWQALWRGKEVDLKMAWDQSSASRVRNMSKGFKIMQDSELDLTPKVLGHVVREGKIMGIVTERASGRPVQAGDYDLVCEAIVQLYENRILFRLPDPMWAILITDDKKVRFLDPSQVEIYSHDKEADFRRMLDKHCWKKIYDMFDIFKQSGALVSSYHEATPNLHILGNPSPTRPLSKGCLLRVTMTLQCLHVFEDEKCDQCACHPQRNNGSQELVSRTQRIRSNVRSLGRCPGQLLPPEEVAYDVLNSLDLPTDDMPYIPPNSRILLDLSIYEVPHTSSNSRVVLEICDSPYIPEGPRFNSLLHSSRVEGLNNLRFNLPLKKGRDRSPSLPRRNVRHRAGDL